MKSKKVLAEELSFTNVDIRRRQEQADGLEIAPDYAIPESKARVIIKEFNPHQYTNEFTMYNPLKRK